MGTGSMLGPILVGVVLALGAGVHWWRYDRRR